MDGNRKTIHLLDCYMCEDCSIGNVLCTTAQRGNTLLDFMDGVIFCESVGDIKKL